MTIDVASLLQSQQEGGVSTDFVPVPVGEYFAIVDKVEARQVQGTKDTSKTYTFINIMWSIEDPNVKALLGREKVTVRQEFGLEFTEAGGIDRGKGKNVQLGRTLEALGLNKPGEPWNFDQFTGRQAKVSVKHDVYKGAPQAKVDAVVKA